jgi:outer membrane scaffolding protein for murein synthesis (MipA/OmpV family)
MLWAVVAAVICVSLSGIGAAAAADESAPRCAPRAGKEKHCKRNRPHEPSRAALKRKRDGLASDQEEVVQTISHTRPDWRLALGSTTLGLPRFEGARRYLAAPLPLIDIAYRDIVSFSVLDGLQIVMLRDGPFSAGPLLKLDFDHRVARVHPLAAIEPLQTVPDAGGFAQYQFLPSLTGRIEVRQSLNSHLGLEVKSSGTYTKELAAGVSASIGPLVRWGNDIRNESALGVTAPRSLASGLPIFSPGAGVSSVGGEGEIEFEIAARTTLAALAEYDRVVGRSALSPVIRFGGSANQFWAGVSLSYRILGR